MTSRQLLTVTLLEPHFKKKNYQLLDTAMTAAGFVGYVNEWWDYRDTEMDAYQPLAADPNDYAWPITFK